MTLDIERDETEPQHYYAIDMDWYQEQGRSFMALATSRMCPTSQKKAPKTEAALLKAIKQCCFKSEQYITQDMPLLEIVFRLFLANSNNPLSLQQLQARLAQLYSSGSNSRDIATIKLKQIIDNDRYYGLRPVEMQDTTELSP